MILITKICNYSCSHNLTVFEVLQLFAEYQFHKILLRQVRDLPGGGEVRPLQHLQVLHPARNGQVLPGHGLRHAGVGGQASSVVCEE